MSTQPQEQEWGLLYYRKKAQFNEYEQFKTKSFQYQKLLGKLHYLFSEDEQNQKKQLKSYIKSLNSTLEDIKNIFSQISEEMKFLKLQNFATLIESLEQLVTSVHHYTMEDLKNRLDYGWSIQSKESEINQINTCQKCMGSINQLNLKKLFDEITTTESSVEDEASKMTKQQRKKLITDLDEYDILLAQKQNYLKKVNAVLESKGKVGQLSNHDKTYNFLSQYLSKIEMIQQRRAKSYNKSNPNLEADDRKWEEESYQHILQYIKRVLFEHFVNQCSGPVKKMFEKINIDKLFKSFDDNSNQHTIVRPNMAMHNHQTQTININEVQQLKAIERRLQFKQKEITTIRINKDELEKKYLTTLDVNRKVESELFELRKQKKWFESEMKIANQNLKTMTQKYEEAVRNYQEDQKRTIERYINERQKLIRASKIMQNDLAMLKEQHKICERTRNKAKQLASAQTQTLQQEFPEQSIDRQCSPQSIQLKRRKSKVNKLLFSSLNGDKKNGSFQRDFIKGLPSFQAMGNDSIQEKDQKESRGEKRLQICSDIVSVKIWSQKDCKIGKPLGKNQGSKENDQRLLYKQKQSMQRKLIQRNQNKRFGLSKENKRFMMSMQSLKNRKESGKTEDQPNNSINFQKSPYKFSNFNRRTEADDIYRTKKTAYNLALPEEINQMEKSQRRLTQMDDTIKHGWLTSDRLYSNRKMKESKELPFERVIQNGKEKFYIKKISRESINYKLQKEKMKQISQILKPYVYNQNQIEPSPPKGRHPGKHLKTIRQHISQLHQKPLQTNQIDNQQNQQADQQVHSKKQNHSHQRTPSLTKNIGKDILSVQHIIESQYAYLKAVGFIDFLMKIGKENKKMVKTINKIQSEVKEKFKSPNQNDLEIFGGKIDAENYIAGKGFWSLDDIRENMMIYNKNDGLSLKVQKYFTLLKRANPQLYGVLINFLYDPIFVVFGEKSPVRSPHYQDENNFVRDIFNQLQKYHKIKHNQCTHIIDFLQKIGFYKYTYF